LAMVADDRKNWAVTHQVLSKILRSLLITSATWLPNTPL